MRSLWLYSREELFKGLLSRLYLESNEKWGEETELMSNYLNAKILNQPWMYGQLELEVPKSWMFQGRIDLDQLYVCSNCADINYGFIDCGNPLIYHHCNKCNTVMQVEDDIGEIKYAFAQDWMYEDDKNSMDQYNLDNPLGAYEFASDMEWPVMEG